MKLYCNMHFNMYTFVLRVLSSSTSHLSSRKFTFMRFWFTMECWNGSVEWNISLSQVNSSKWKHSKPLRLLCRNTFPSYLPSQWRNSLKQRTNHFDFMFASIARNFPSQNKRKLIIIQIHALLILASMLKCKLPRPPRLALTTCDDSFLPRR